MAAAAAIEKLNLSNGRAGIAGGSKRSVYLMDCTSEAVCDARPRQGDGGCVRRPPALRRRAGVAARQSVAAENVGSMAVVVVVCSSHVVVANCGDSRIVLCRGKEPVALSIDHKPDRKDERARIEAEGGKVIQWNGYRVSGILAMSRSIGDRYLKPFVIPKPEVTVIPRAKDDDCLILASDGLWDVVSDEEACKVARRQIQLWHKNNGVTPSLSDEGGESTDPATQAAANYLARLALKKGSEDNITVIVVDLKPRKKVKNNS